MPKRKISEIIASQGAIKPCQLPKKVRWFVFTDFEMTVSFQDMVEDGDVVFVAVGKEMCPKTQRKHNQGFFYLKDTHAHGDRARKNLSLKLFQNNKTWMRPVLGSMEQNERYCKKEGFYTEYGEKPAQGTRTDLQILANQVVQGLDPEDVYVENIMNLHLYSRSFDRLRNICMKRKKRTEAPVAIFLYGPTGVGKSRMRDLFDEDILYAKTDSAKWDNYEQQPVCFIDELRERTFPGDVLLRLADKYRYEVDIKYKEPIPFVSSLIIITSPVPIEQIYNNWVGGYDQFHRRYMTFYVTREGDKTTFWPKGSFAAQHVKTIETAQERLRSSPGVTPGPPDLALTHIWDNLAGN
jgi:hypothetical protein